MRKYSLAVMLARFFENGDNIKFGQKKIPLQIQREINISYLRARTKTQDSLYLPTYLPTSLYYIRSKALPLNKTAVSLFPLHYIHQILLHMLGVFIFMFFLYFSIEQFVMFKYYSLLPLKKEET